MISKLNKYSSLSFCLKRKVESVFFAVFVPLPGRERAQTHTHTHVQTLAVNPAIAHLPLTLALGF